MKIVTAGFPYIDIDAYAGCIAYAELLNLQGEAAIAASSATLNESVSKTIRGWDVPFETDYADNGEDTFIIVDLSDPEHLDTFVNSARIEELIDHHPSFETYWNDRIGGKAQIDFIGSVCTLIYERWEQAGLAANMQPATASLLISAILDNTLNFKAGVTDERDKAAYAELLKIADVPANWPEQYFRECQTAILSDVGNSLRNDTKTINFTKLANKNIAVGQLVIWDADKILSEHLEIIQQTMEAKNPKWLINIVSISEGRSYFVSENMNIQAWAKLVLGVEFDGPVARADRLWLRKEMVQRDLSPERR